jgi:hypothetical protein
LSQKKTISHAEHFRHSSSITASLSSTFAQPYPHSRTDRSE